ncbi:MAG: peptidoglycan DD-metalloendopeptidase family protein [Succinivibrio sp.]|jgi:lipoprotein NlpD|nr:peptidoglycan DD-metalloendopeptidase family protein [Succinivibrio sp.]
MCFIKLFSEKALAASLPAALAAFICGCSGDSSSAQVVDATSDARAQHYSAPAPKPRERVINRTVRRSQSIREQPVAGGGTGVVRTSGTDYRVVQGDTLYSIAFRYGQDYRTLAADNGIEPPYAIKTGQVIHIGSSQAQPAAAPSEASAGGTYTVKKGDTLTSVAREHGLPPSALVRVNSLKYPYTLRPGQVLTLADPDARQPQSSPAASGGIKDTVTSTTVTTVKEDKEQEPQAPVSVASGRTRTVGGITWMWPASGKVIRGFSLNENGNKGIDIAGQRGQNVVSAADGQVVYAGSALRGYGNLVIINHANEYLSAYAHNDSLLVKEGQQVRRGQAVARMGSTDSDRVNLHFEIRYKGKSVNPLNCLPR